MNILHTVEYYYPSIGGAQEAVRQISEALVKQGHKVTVATTRVHNRTEHNLNGVKIVDFEIHGNSVNGLSGETEQYKKFLLENNFDIIMNYAAQQWTADVFFEVMDKVSAKKVFVPCGFSGLYEPAYKDYFDKMPEVLRKYDALVFLSNNYRDIDFARQNNIDNLHTITNGASKQEFKSKVAFNIRKKLSIPEKDFLIILIGSHTHLKGHKEAIDIFKKANIHNATLLIIAGLSKKGCEKECKKAAFWFNLLRFSRERKSLKVMSLSRKDTIAILKSTDLMLFPSNIECSPIVLFEAMAAKIPFLVTDVGNSKEIIKWSKGGVLLPTIIKDGYSFADIDPSAILLEELYNDKKKRQQLADSGFKSWQRNYTWEHIAKQYEQLYSQLTQ